MTGAPQVLRDFFVDMPPADPTWLDYEAFIPGIRAFHRNSGLILSGFAAGVLVDSFTTYIAKSFVLTGGLWTTACAGCDKTTATSWILCTPEDWQGTATVGSYRYESA